jgi:serine/threonine protein kinase
LATHSSEFSLYKVLEIVDVGGFATVCVARNVQTGRASALKVVNQAHVRNPKVINRTRDEARILSLMDHPNIVDVEALMVIDGHPVMVMEWVEGVNLDVLLRFHPDGIPVAEATEICRLVLSALRAAFEAKDWTGAPLNVIHRDVKPSNILLSVHGEVKLVDFGIAHGDFQDKESETITMLLGARSFMAPERLDGQSDRPAGDVYAAGLVLFALLTGKRLELSMHAGQHKRLCDAGLARLSPPGLGESDTERIRYAISRMVAYDADARPTHSEAEELLLSFCQLAGIQPLLVAFGEDNVAPLWARRQVQPPQENRFWPEVSFLETASDFVSQALPGVRQKAASLADRKVRTFLNVEQWHLRMVELQRLLALHPQWTAAPFLDRLEAIRSPWWRFWGGAAPSAVETAAILEVLKQRITPGTLRWAQELSAHSDPNVAQVARELFKQGSS